MGFLHGFIELTTLNGQRHFQNIYAISAFYPYKKGTRIVVNAMVGNIFSFNLACVDVRESYEEVGYAIKKAQSIS